MTTSESTTSGKTSRQQLIELLAGDLRSLPVAAGLGALGAFFATQSDVFLTPQNLSNLLIQSATTGIIALGLIFVLLVAEIDLSVAAISGLGSVFMARLVVEFGFSIPVAVGAAVALGVLVGVVSGLWTTRLLVPSFVVTLGMGLVLNGTQLVMLPRTGRYNLLGTGVERIAATNVTGVAAWFTALVAIGGYAYIRYSTYQSKGQFDVDRSLLRDLLAPVLVVAAISAVTVAVLTSHKGIPSPVLIFIGMLAVAGYFVNETTFGVHLYAVGGDVEAARRMGIDVDRVKTVSFALAGGLSAFAGVLAASRILGVSVSSGGGIGGGALLLNSIAAAVIGGVSLFGGRGRVSAALLGALVIGTVSNGLNLMGVESEIKLVVTGALLILAVSVDRTIERFTRDGQ
jgi:D-xylose transport system permease protein